MGKHSGDALSSTGGDAPAISAGRVARVPQQNASQSFLSVSLRQSFLTVSVES